MSAELGDWLAELCTIHPASATEVAAALTSVMTADDPASLLLVSQPADSLDPREAVDYAYQDQLEALQHVQTQAGDAATDTRHCAAALRDAESASPPDEVLAPLRLRLAEAEQHERDQAARSHRLQSEVDAFRTAKEVAKAMYTAAEASLRIRETLADEIRADETTAAKNTAAKNTADEAEARLQAAADQLRSLHHPHRQAAADVLELRADALGRDVRLLMAVEPADTVTLLAVLDGDDAIIEHRAEAIELAGDLLTDIRAGDWPPADALDAADLEVTFADSATFLARFFPADTGAVAERATVLAAAQSLAGLRSGTGMSLADVATETGISEERLRFIEGHGLRVAEVREAVAYVRALGGLVTLTAQLADATPVPLT